MIDLSLFCRAHPVGLEYEPLELCGAKIAHKYYRLIKTLPNPRYFDISIDHESPIPFVFDGGQGVAMSLLEGE